MQIKRVTKYYDSALAFLLKAFHTAREAGYDDRVSLLLSGKACHETGWHPHCNSPGNVKTGRKWIRDGKDYYTMTAPECVPGTPQSPMCEAGEKTVNVGATWRAYDSLTAGMRGIVEYLHEQASGRYKHAIPMLMAGNPEYFHELGRVGYYTGDKGIYYHRSAGFARKLAHDLGGDVLKAYESMKMLASWRERQLGLLVAGHSPGKVDGDRGPKTEAAILSFQTKAGIHKDGWWGPQTRRTLRAELLSPATAPPVACQPS